MRFNRSLGNVHLPRDFRVVTALEKQFYDLPLAGTDLVKNFVHIKVPA